MVEYATFPAAKCLGRIMEPLTPEDRQMLEEKVQVARPWVGDQEQFIHQSSSSLHLTDAQQADARRIGLRHPDRVRLLYVETIPVLDGFPPPKRGLAARYGIFVGAAFREERRLVVHELVHTMQYERYGGIEEFLRPYLYECLFPPYYPHGPLEQEARRIEHEICA